MAGPVKASTSQEVTNATILLEIQHLGDKLDEHLCADKERNQDHETRIRKLEETNAVARYVMGAWNLINTAAAILAGALSLKGQ